MARRQPSIPPTNDAPRPSAGISMLPVSRGYADAELVTLAVDGDRDAYAELVERHLEKSYAVAFALTGCAAESDDLVQEAFLGAMLGLDRLENRARFGAWITGIVRRLDANRRRSSRRRREVLDGVARERDVPLVDPHAPSQSPVDDERLWTAIEALPTDLRLPLLLFYFEGESTAAVADRLGLSDAAARKRVQLARDRLRIRLSSSMTSDQALRTALPRPSLDRMRPGRRLRTALAITIASTPFAATASAATARAVESALTIGGSWWARRSTVGGALPAQLASLLLLSIGIYLVWQSVEPTGSPLLTDHPRPTPGWAAGFGPARTAPTPQATATSTSSAPVTPTVTQSAPIVETVVPRVARVAGTLRDPNGRPIVADQIYLGVDRHPWGFAESRPVAPDGTFSFDLEREADRWVYLRIGHAFICPPNSWVRPRLGSTEVLDLVLEPGVVLSGRVLDVDGAPVERARVTLETPIANQQGESLADTDRDGRFSIPHLPEGAHRVSITHPGFTQHFAKLELNQDAAHTFTLAPERSLELRVVGLPEHCFEEELRLSLRAEDALANREELLVMATPDRTGTLTIACPPPGDWTGTFFGSLPNRRFELSIPAGRATVARTVDLEEGALLTGAVYGLDPGDPDVDPSTWGVRLIDVSDVGGRGARLLAPIDITPSGRRYTHAGIPSSDYLAGVLHRIGGHPFNREQPEWIFYALERLSLREQRSSQLDLHLPRSQPVKLTPVDPRGARTSSIVNVRITPFDHPGYFGFVGRTSAPRRADGVGALAISTGTRPITLDHLAGGSYRVDGSIDGDPIVPRVIEVHAEGAPLEVELTRVASTVVAIQMPAVDLPRNVGVQCPPAPDRERYVNTDRWAEAYARWWATSTLRDRLDPRFAQVGTVQQFVPPSNDFTVGWHYARSLIVREWKAAGTRPVRPSGVIEWSLPSDLDPQTFVRVEAPGFPPLLLRAAELFEAAASGEPLSVEWRRARR